MTVFEIPRTWAGAGIKAVLPESTRRWLRRRLSGWPFGVGVSHRVSPSSPLFGLQGRPVDRFYIEDFLEQTSADIQGRVLEIGDQRYTLRFGSSRVTSSDVLHVIPGNPHATIVADLTMAMEIDSSTFDCIILTQTLQMIYDIEAALGTLRRILKPRGVVLATLPGIAPVSRYDMERWGDYWRFTSLSARRLFETAFRPSEIRVEAYGNLLSATAFLRGLAAEDLGAAELSRRDDDYEVVIAVRAVRNE
jgi:SAM-dependent methyltransferase